MRSDFPIYIPTKGRWETRLTVDYLESFGRYPTLVVEPDEYANYRSVVHPNTEIIVLPDEAKEAYDTCDGLGGERSRGSGPARNFAWDHAEAEGHEWFWLIDDNIRGLAKPPLYNWIGDGTGFVLMEDATRQFANVSMSGPDYHYLVPRMTPRHYKQDLEKWKRGHLANTRIMSCSFIRTGSPFRFRGRYNEDVITSLDMLKAGWCTINYYSIVQCKAQTQTMKGGNTDEIYRGPGGGTWAKSKMLYDVHPDVTRLVWRYNRCHHVVDYTRFRRMNKLVRDPAAPPKRISKIALVPRSKT